MASVPAESNPSNMPAAREGDAPESRSDLFMGFNRLNLLRQIGLMVGLAASVALGLAVVLWAQEPNYQPVVGDLSSYNPQDVTSILDNSDIDYKMDPRTGALLVPSEQVYDARLKLAAEGVTDRQTMGYELLDQERGLGTSQFMETISYRRGLEGELARTVASMRGVRNARVHLAIPERSVFVRDARDPSASVFLEVFAGRRPEQEQINAIVNLVAGSVPMMSKEHVTVVDQNGNLLTGKESQSTADQMADQYEYTAKVEERLTRRVASLPLSRGSFGRSGLFLGGAGGRAVQPRTAGGAQRAGTHRTACSWRPGRHPRSAGESAPGRCHCSGTGRRC